MERLGITKDSIRHKLGGLYLLQHLILPINISLIEFFQLSIKLQEANTVEEVREIALETLKMEIDKWKSNYREMVENHHKQIDETKKKEWVQNLIDFFL